MLSEYAIMHALVVNQGRERTNYITTSFLILHFKGRRPAGGNWALYNNNKTKPKKKNALTFWWFRILENFSQWCVAHVILSTPRLFLLGLLIQLYLVQTLRRPEWYSDCVQHTVCIPVYTYTHTYILHTIVILCVRACYNSCSEYVYILRENISRNKVLQAIKVTLPCVLLLCNIVWPTIPSSAAN